MTEGLYKYIYNKYFKQLALFAAKYCSTDVCCDIVQDVFICLWESNIEFENDYHMKAYIYKSTYNRCLNHIKRENYVNQKLSKIPEDTILDDESISFELLESDIYMRIFEEIDKLPDKSREIFKLSYVDNLNSKTISEILKISVNTIKTQKMRAKNKIKLSINMK